MKKPKKVCFALSQLTDGIVVHQHSEGCYVSPRPLFRHAEFNWTDLGKCSIWSVRLICFAFCRAREGNFSVYHVCVCVHTRVCLMQSKGTKKSPPRDIRSQIDQPGGELESGRVRLARFTSAALRQLIAALSASVRICLKSGGREGRLYQE